MRNNIENLFVELFICQRKFEQALKEIVNKFEILRNNWEIFFVTYIHKNPGLTQYDLCKKFDIERSHINKIIKRLEGENLIEMRALKDKKIHKKKLYLTKDGSSMACQILKIILHFKKELFENHPISNFSSFLNDVSHISKVPKEYIIDTANKSITTHYKN